MVYLWFISKKTIIFQGFRGGPTIPKGGGPTFSRRPGLNDNLYRNPYIELVIFQGGGGLDPLSPLWIRTCCNAIHKGMTYIVFDRCGFMRLLKEIQTCKPSLQCARIDRETPLTCTFANIEDPDEMQHSSGICIVCKGKKELQIKEYHSFENYNPTPLYDRYVQWTITSLLEDLTGLKRSPDLLNNVRISQDQLWLIMKHILSYGRGGHLGHVTKTV